MKKSLLSLVASFLCIASAFSQNYAPDYRFNVGVYGGLAPTTRFYNLVDYSTDEKSLPNIFGVIGHYNFTEHFQIGLDINTNSEWSSKGNNRLNGLNGETLGNVDVRYLYADRVFTTSVRANGLVPLYDRYRDNRSNFYYGASFGAIFTVNDGRQVYTQFDEKPGEEYRYVSAYHYERAAGYTFGLQFGMEWYARGPWGVNVEGAARFAHLNTVDNRISGRNGPYDLFYFPLTVGIRYRFGTGY